MVHRSAALAFMGLVLGCGGSDAADTPAPGPSTPSSSQPAETPPSAALPPPEVQLTWLPGGGLALENADDGPVSLARELTLQAGEGSEPTRLQLGLDCASAGAPTPAGAAACITLVPGAALALGRWPDDHGACRCPPCVDTAEAGSFVIHTCDQGQALTRSLPPR
ncbi:MAG: hypothetical protein IPG17_13800 [Sandaracinaceae bacterium]|nr:hypothetical protein [Sandaracinaceae bacterium]MBP7683477.1 hypothetical protein [Deltaproteobacteria bacterium]